METAEKKNTTFIIASVVLALGFVLLVASILKVKKTDYKTPITPTEQNMSGETYSLNLVLTSSQWTVGEEQEVSVEFAELPSTLPTVYTLVITVDPSLIEIVSADSGDIWSGVNVLQNEVDNTAGKVTVTVGQGFTDSATGGKVLSTIRFLPKAETSSAVIEIGVNSQTAVSGVGSQLVGNPLTVSIY